MSPTTSCNRIVSDGNAGDAASTHLNTCIHVAKVFRAQRHTIIFLNHAHTNFYSEAYLSIHTHPIHGILSSTSSSTAASAAAGANHTVPRVSYCAMTHSEMHARPLPKRCCSLWKSCRSLRLPIADLYSCGHKTNKPQIECHWGGTSIVHQLLFWQARPVGPGLIQR